ncbi:YaaL family protein [Clostridium bornimense]|uniref:YaaL family protein n=1 Tax=Clostridium bornimense TaxID=1216932 RepID=UPI001C120631|nr:YaaL family protein [Clostridium bornimense]MBU5317036.1 YaaL family protein [Clostridium bornimense]
MFFGFDKGYKAEKLKYEEEKREIVDSINEVQKDLEICRGLFESSTDASLLEFAIYYEAALKNKYDYLLKLAKIKNISVDFTYYADLERSSNE